MKRNNVLLLIGTILFMVSYILNYPISKIPQEGFSILSSATMSVMTPIGLLGMVIFLIGLNGLKRVSHSFEKEYDMITEKEKKILTYFAPMFLLYVSSRLFLRHITKPYTISLIIEIFVSLFAILFFVFTWKSTVILKKYGKTKIYPIIWLLLLLFPISFLVTPIIIWHKNYLLLKEKR